jgi:flavodoxin
MKTLIVYASIHHQNTEKMAKVMAAELESDLVHVGQAQPSTLAAYDLIGFGSGIYGGKFHKTLIQFVGALPTVTEKQAFVFSTCGVRGTQLHAALKSCWRAEDSRSWASFPAKDGIRTLFSNFSEGLIREDQMRKT